MKETKKKVKKTTKQKQRQKQQQEQNVVVNINQPTKRKYTKRAPKAVPKHDNKPQQQFRGPIMAPTYNPPIVLREPPSTQNELFAKLFETKQERENNTQPNLLVGGRVPNVDTRQEKAHNDLERVRQKRVEKLDVATAPLPAKSDLVYPEYQEATQSALAAFKERFQARAPPDEPLVLPAKVKLGGRRETRYPSSSSLLDDLKARANTPFEPFLSVPDAKVSPKKAEVDMFGIAQQTISLLDQLNLGEQPEAPEHSSHKAAPIVDTEATESRSVAAGLRPLSDLDADILFSGEGQENGIPLEPAQPLESVSLGTLGQGAEELTAQLTTASTPVKLFSSGEDLGLVGGKSRRADLGIARGAHRSTEQIQLQKYIDSNLTRGSENLERLKSTKSLTKTELITILNMPDGYQTAKRILSEIGINYVPPFNGSKI